MSYILDALRRADAERERGAVPSLHTQQYGAMPGDEDDTPRRGRWPTIAAVAIAVALLALVGWHYLGAEASPPAATSIATSNATSLPTSRSTLPPAAAPAPIGIGSTPATTAGGGATTTITAPPTPLAPAPVRRSQPHPPVATAGVDRADRPPPAAAAGDRVYAMAELPDDVRRDLPKLAFGGASYSADPGSRMVILDGQVFHEGDSVGHGLVVQRVNRKSAVLAVRGYRFELVF